MTPLETPLEELRQALDVAAVRIQRNAFDEGALAMLNQLVRDGKVAKRVAATYTPINVRETLEGRP